MTAMRTSMQATLRTTLWTTLRTTFRTIAAPMPKRPTRSLRRRHAARGLGLVELMIAVTLGMLILLAIMRIYITSLDSQQAQADVAQLDDSARTAFDAIGAAVRKTGFRSPLATPSQAQFCSAAAGGGVSANAGPTLLGKNAPGAIDPASPTLGGSTVTLATDSDVLRVRYFGTAAPGEATVRDCLGNAVAGNALVEDTFYVANDTANGGQPALFCHTMVVNATPPLTSGIAAPLVAGFETLQLLYGEDTDGDGVTNQYLPWRNGVTVVVRATSQGNATKTGNFALFGPNYPATLNTDTGANFSATSGPMRKMFDAELALRNFHGCDTL
jgi:type IV pilus assembly protein PilW